MTNLKTNPDLIAALKEAAGQKMSPAEVREQRISFVMSTIEDDAEITRADVERLVDEREGQAA